MNNFNDLRIRCRGGGSEPLVDYSLGSGDTQVYFRDLESKLIEKILEADVVVGCVAWFTNEKIINAMSKIKGVSVVMQKEDFLRPDFSNAKNWNTYLTKLYSKIRFNGLSKYFFHKGIMKEMSYLSPTVEYLRCVGNHNADKKPASPRMHNKFLVFCHKKSKNYEPIHNGYICDSHYYDPYAVWTGSFNFTKNATMSFENAVYINNCDIAEKYFYEFQQIYALSEDLDWTSEWCKPDMRIGS